MIGCRSHDPKDHTSILEPAPLTVRRAFSNQPDFDHWVIVKAESDKRHEERRMVAIDDGLPFTAHWFSDRIGDGYSDVEGDAPLSGDPTAS